MVLLVEDEDQLRRVMKDLLEREGYTVVEARDGVQALDQVDRHAPDIIILDLNLPGVDGYSRAEPAPLPAGHPRRSRSWCSPPRATRTTRCGCFELGADDFLTKPFRAKALAARLESALGRRAAVN